MAILLDLIVIALIVLSTFLGYKKGLIGAIFKILSFFIALIITLLLYKPVSTYIIEHTTFDETIENVIVEKLSSTTIKNGKVVKQDSDLPEVIVNYINEGVENTVNKAKDNIVMMVAKNLSESVIHIITILGLFIITRLLLVFAKVLLQAVSEIPLIKQFNELGGILYGMARGILFIYLLLAILSFLLPMLDKTMILEYINQTILTKMFYDHNVIFMLFFR